MQPREVSSRPVQSASEDWPHYSDDEIEAAVAVLRSGKVNQWTGDKVSAFERAYSEHLGTGHAVAVANGSLALELALRALGIGPGDEVIVTPRSFVASASCVRLVGATPVFADIEEDSGNISAATIEPVLTERTKAVIPVHLAGWPVDMPAIMALAARSHVKVIEDCAQAHGAEIGGRPVGSFGDAAAFSFCQDKIISTGGEGGMAVFRDKADFERAWSYKDHGKNRHKLDQPQLRPGFRWLHDSLGSNWRMLEMSAAIGLIQLRKLPEWRRLRTRNAGIWADALRRVAGVRVTMPPENMTGAFYKYHAYLDVAERQEELRGRILAEASARGIPLFAGSCPEIYREAAFADLAVAPLPVAARLGRTSLMFEVHPTLDPERLAARAEAVAGIVAGAIEASA